MGSEADWGGYEGGSGLGALLGVMAIVRCVCSCELPCVYLYGASAVGSARARLCLGLPDCPLGCVVLLSFFDR